MKYDYLIVGAGPSGSVLAERLANQAQLNVLVVDRRDHVGGNTYDYRNADGLFVQQYGPHIFHTRIESVWDYLADFTDWNDYVHRVLAKVRGKTVPLPICLETMEQLHGRPFTPEQLKAYFDEHKVHVETVDNARQAVVSQVGEELYELFFKNYTKKQWGVYPEQLSAEVTRRLPVRFNRDTRYFSDPHQGLPTEGFTVMVQRMLDSPRIEVRLNTDYRDVVDSVTFDRLIYTGPIDEFFNYNLGKLPYRSLIFKFETLDQEWLQAVGVVNYPNDEDYTRITEFKHLYCQEHPKTAVCYEYSTPDGEPYYPIPSTDNRQLYAQYRAQAETLDGVHFLGRLAQYAYLNMDQVVDRALRLFERIRAGD